MSVLPWIGFNLFVLGLLALDLGVFNRRSHVITPREALAWTAFWVVLALAFNVLVFYLYEHHWFGVGLEIGHELTGKQAALQFLTGYVVEKSLSLDNVFVIALIFVYFRVPLGYQHRVLFWGILGALILRGVMILGGAALINRFDWTVYVFGAFLIVTSVKLLIVRHDNLEPENNPLVRLARRVYPVTKDFEGLRFFSRVGTKRAITPLFLALIVVESTDVLFAVDSIPAIFAVTRDPFLVYTSNVFAILGLRSLYFALAGVMDRFRYLKMSLVFVLAFVGVKMLLSHHHPIPTPVSLAVIAGILSIGILASIFGATRDTAPLVSPLADEIEELARMTWQQGRRLVTIIIGTTVLLLGVAMIVLPGPAVIFIPAGLALLGTEFIWARRLLRRLQNEADRLKETVRHAMEQGRNAAGEEPD
ncbi:TerC/Alx family metal homeostasis membrane protein [Gemmatimonadota bacterium]